MSAAEAARDGLAQRRAMVARGAEALDLSVERLLEAGGDMSLRGLSQRVAAAAQDALSDFAPTEAREAVYRFIAMRLIKQQGALLHSAGGPFADGA